MKKSIIFLFCMAVCTAGCINDDDSGLFSCPKGEGSLVETTFEITNFTGITLKCSGDVFISQGDFYSVTAKTQSNIVDKLDFRLDGDILEMDIDGCVRDITLDIFVTLPQLDFIKITGSGDVRGESEFSGETLRVRLTGSGSAVLDADYENIDAQITGSGDIFFSGICDRIDYKITGSGDINSFDLNTDEAFVEITGSGDAEVFVNELLNVKITGSGDVLFKGSPDEIITDITGSGDLRDVN